jgi:hypothetical protein
MEKQLSLVGYWLGLIRTGLALILRMLTALKMLPSPWVFLVALSFLT